jgi:hypothetical protein
MRSSILLGCLLAVYSACAATVIYDVSFSGEGIFQDNYVQPGRTIAATMTFTINESYEYLTLIVNEEEVPVVKSTCGNPCSIPVTLVISSTGTQQDFTYSVRADNGDTQTLRTTFRKDIVKPVAKTLGTLTCQNNCAVKTGENTLVAYFQETGSGMNAATVFLLDKSSDSTILASRCEQDKCFFTVLVESDSGYAEFEVLQAAKDYAGNTANEKITASLGIDNSAPVIETVSTQHVTGGLPTGTTIITGTFDLKIKVQDASAISATVDATAILPVDATETTKTMACIDGACTVRITPRAYEEGNDEATLLITVTDSAGNTEQQSLTLQLREIDATGGDFWQATGVVRPETLEKGSLKFFSKTFYIQVPLASQTAGTEVAYVSASQCTALVNGERKTLPLGTPSVQAPASREPVVVVTLRPTNELDDVSGVLTLNCSISITTTQGGTVFQRPEQEQVLANIQLVRSPLIPEQLAEIQRKTDSDLREFQNNYQTYKQYYTVGKGICEGIQSINAATNVLTGVQGVLSRTTPPGTATPVRVTEEQLSKLNDFLQNEPFGQTMCAALTCKGGGVVTNMIDNNLDLLPASQQSILDNVAMYTTGNPSSSAFVRPDKSIFVAVATGCIPEIVNHIDRMTGIQCNYNSCLQTQVPRGLPVSACQAQRSQQTCRYVAGGVFYTFPLSSAVQTIRDNAIAVLTNPFATAGYVSTLSCAFIPEDHTNFLCKIPKTVRRFQGGVRFVQDLKQAGAVFSNRDNAACIDAENRISTYQSIGAQASCTMHFCCSGEYCKIGPTYYQKVKRTTNEAQYGLQAGESEEVRAARLAYLSSGYTFKEVKSVPTSVSTNIENAEIFEGVNSDRIGDVASEIDEEYAAFMADARELQDMRKQRDAMLSLQVQFNDRKQTSKSLDAYRADALAATQQLISGFDEDEQYEIMNRISRAGSIRDVNDEIADFSRKYSAELASSIENLDKDVKKQAKEVSKKAKQIAEQEYFAKLQDPNNRNFAFAQAANNALVFAQTASTFGLNNPKWSTGWSDTVSNLPNPEEAFVKNICEEVVIRRVPQAIGLGPKGRISMYLHGTRTSETLMTDLAVSEEEIIPAGTTLHAYLVGGTVSNPEKAASYTVYLSGVQGVSAPIFEGDIGPGATAPWGGANSLLKLRSTIEYSEVCIEFNKDIDDLFDSTTRSGNKVCLPLQVQQ